MHGYSDKQMCTLAHIRTTLNAHVYICSNTTVKLIIIIIIILLKLLLM